MPDLYPIEPDFPGNYLRGAGAPSVTVSLIDSKFGKAMSRGMRRLADGLIPRGSIESISDPEQHTPESLAKDYSVDEMASEAYNRGQTQRDIRDTRNRLGNQAARTQPGTRLRGDFFSALADYDSAISDLKDPRLKPSRAPWITNTAPSSVNAKMAQFQMENAGKDEAKAAILSRAQLALQKAGVIASQLSNDNQVHAGFLGALANFDQQREQMGLRSDAVRAKASPFSAGGVGEGYVQRFNNFKGMLRQVPSLAGKSDEELDAITMSTLDENGVPVSGVVGSEIYKALVTIEDPLERANFALKYLDANKYESPDEVRTVADEIVKGYLFEQQNKKSQPQRSSPAMGTEQQQGLPDSLSGFAQQDVLPDDANAALQRLSIQFGGEEQSPAAPQAQTVNTGVDDARNEYDPGGAITSRSVTSHVGAAPFHGAQDRGIFSPGDNPNWNLSKFEQWGAETQRQNESKPFDWSQLVPSNPFARQEKQESSPRSFIPPPSVSQTFDMTKDRMGIELMVPDESGAMVPQTIMPYSRFQINDQAGRQVTAQLIPIQSGGFYLYLDDGRMVKVAQGDIIDDSIFAQ